VSSVFVCDDLVGA